MRASEAAAAKARILGIAGHENAADRGAPFTRKPLLGNGAVAGELTFKKRTNVVQRHRAGGFDEFGDVPTLDGVLFFGAVPLFPDNLAVLFNAGHVRVRRADDGRNAVAVQMPRHADEENVGFVRLTHFDGRRLDEFADAIAFFRRNRGEHFKSRFGLRGHEPGDGRGFKSRQTARVRNDHALDVLHDVAGDVKLDALGIAPETLRADGRGVGERDGLGTAHRGQEFGRKRRFVNGIRNHR